MSQVVSRETDKSKGSEQSYAAQLKRAAAVFPLPLTPFERYMLVDDRPDYPMTYAYVVDLHGVLDREAMESAILSALARHPLTCSKVREIGTQDCWVLGSLPQQPVTWHDVPPSRLPFAGQRVDPSAESCFRIDGFSTGESPYLVFSTHHAVTDGLGLLQIVGDAMAAYAAEKSVSERQPELVELDPSRLRNRGVYQVSIPHPVSAWTVVKSMIGEAWKMFSRQPALITARNGLKPSADVQRDYVVVTVDDQDLAPVRKLASQSGATLNDVLIRDLFQIMGEWTEGQSARSGPWLRLAIPTSLRSRQDRATPATNILGYTFLTRHRSECKNSGDLLKGIVEEVNFVQRWAMGTMFSAAVAFVDRFPGMLSFVTRRRRRLVSAVLSNLGEVTRRMSAKLPRKNGQVVVGNLTLTNLTAAPPVRPGTSLALAITGCAGKLNFCAQYDSQVISESDVRVFLAKYVQQVLKTERGTSQRSTDSFNDQAGR